MKIHALWCHPRSVSTAFERLMRARGDLKVLHEPFLYYYYLTRRQSPFPGFTPDPDHPKTYEDTRQMIIDLAQNQPVFFKDMAYYVCEELPDDQEFSQNMTHAFLVRNPVQTVLSYAKKDPEFTSLELGLESQFQLFNKLQKAGHAPCVVTADQLRTDPEVTARRYWEHVGLPFIKDAFEWDTSVPEGWKSVVQWHGNVLKQGSIQKPPVTDADDAARLKKLGEPYVSYERHHRPYFEALAQIAEEQAHQK